MTEAEWLACDDPEKLLEAGGATLDPRKLLLFGCACCRLLKWRFTDPRSWVMVETAERFAEGEVTLGQLREVAGQASATWLSTYHPTDPDDRTTNAGRVTAMAAGLFGRALLTNGPSASVVLDAVIRLVCGVRSGLKRSRAPQANLFREVFGNSFRPATLRGEWRTEDVRRIATSIDAEQAFAAMPILADALEEAGCTNADLLSHLRSPGPHVRGCWALDLLLAKS